MANTVKFNVGHFPVGTICEVAVENALDPWPKLVKVLGVICNGPNSYILDVQHLGEDLVHTSTEVDMYNICWVTRIIKRGEGTAVLDKTRTKSRLVHTEKFYQANLGVRHKPKTKYMTFSPTELTHMVTYKYIKDDMLVAWEKLLDLLFLHGVIQSVYLTEYQQTHSRPEGLRYFVVSKKRMNAFIKQVINKCLLNRKKEQARQNKELELDTYNEYWLTSDQTI
jgi:hypothetical protein